MPLTVVPGTVHRAEDYALEPDELAALWNAEDHHFWFRARNRWIVKALRHYGLKDGAHILEVGCGSGTVMRALIAAGFQVSGVDTAEIQVRKAHERNPEADLVVADVGDLAKTGRNNFDALGFFDVVEHVDDPELLMRNALALCRPGALVCATVPAQAALHTVIDDISGHKRRYEAGELAALFRRTGLQGVAEHGIFRSFVSVMRLARRRWMGVSLAGLTAARRREISVASLRAPPGPLNAAMDAIAWLEGSVGFPFSRDTGGASLLAVGFKP